MSIFVFLLCCFCVVYVLGLYPLSVILWARMRPRYVRHNSTYRPKVSVILPVRNGEPWIQSKLDCLAALDYPKDQLEVIVVSDGSTDHTAEIARRTSGLDVHVIELPSSGKPAALNAGIARASGEVLFLTDVRQTLDPQSLGRLVDCLADPNVGVVSGELVIRKGSSHEEANIGLYWSYEKVIRRHVSQFGSFPGATGAIYVIRRELVSQIPVSALLDDVFLPLSAYFKGKRIYWEPAAKAYDFPTSLHAEFRRKVRTLAGVYQIIGYYPRILVPTHPLAFHFISHKLGRLLLPYALAGTIVSSFFLPPLLAVAVASGFVLMAFSAWVNSYVPDWWAVKRITSPARTFVVLMAASLCAGLVLLIPGKQIWTPTTVQTSPSGVSRK